MPVRNLDELLASFFQLHADARKMGEHGAAYHALAGALHAAESLEDAEACMRIERLAREHGEWLDAHEPGHTLASAAARGRGHESIFRQLSLTANSARLRMRIAPKTKGRPKAPLRKARRS